MNQIHDLTSGEAINQIKKLCNAKDSGTIFLMTEKNIMVQIILTEGDIVAVHYLTQRGIDALELIFKSSVFVLFDFIKRPKSASSPQVDPHLPSMASIFDIIKKASNSNINTDVKQVISTNQGSDINLSQVKEIIITELTLHLGPMAAMVCEGYFKHAQDLQDIMGSLDTIANEIEDTAKEIEFKRRVKEKIETL